MISDITRFDGRESSVLPSACHEGNSSMVKRCAGVAKGERRAADKAANKEQNTQEDFTRSFRDTSALLSGFLESRSIELGRDGRTCVF